MYPEAIEHMQHIMRDVPGNASSVHAAGRRARVVIESARRSMAQSLGVQPGTLFFCSGGTEACNALLWMTALSEQRRHYITSPMEHPAVLRSLEGLQKYMGINLHWVRHDVLGHIDQNHLAKLLEKYPRSVVALMHANNETGVLLPLKHIGKLCRQHEALFFSDMVQTIGKLSHSLGELPLDMACGSAHKFRGPKGVGFMYVHEALAPEAWIRGGLQERSMRAGTENTAGISAMAMALEMGVKRMEENHRHYIHLRQHLIKMLLQYIPQAGYIGDVQGSSLPGIINLAMPVGTDASMLLPRLDMEGICVSSGSACSSGSLQRSHVLQALKTDETRASLRISFGEENTEKEIDQLVETLIRLCA